MQHQQHVPHYLRELNPEQREAALATEGPVLILAGAGSGKTRTIVFRIAHLIRERGVDPRRILAITFTNKAAAEMRERVARIAGKEARGALLSTFHSLGARILRESGEVLGLPKNFSIYGTGDQTATAKRVMDEVHVSASAGGEEFDAKKVLWTISDWKNRLVSPEEAKREVIEGRTKGNRSDDYAVLAADVYPRYEQALRAAGACDFDDLLLLPVRLLTDHAEVRERYWKRWHYLMIDEYQDTNGAQLEMARLLAGPRKNLCVVGDDDQSIYAWRGADTRNILDFERHYPGCRVVVLEENYRSTQRILDAANAVILNNTSRKEKRLRTSNGPGPKIDYYEFADAPGKPPAEEQEAAMVTSEISIRRFAEKLQWSDFAVLYRTNLQARPLEEALRAANLPYRVVGGQSYFDRKEVADCVAYLRVVLNARDEVALRRIINYPTRGIGRTTLLKLVEAAQKAGKSLDWALRQAGSIEGISRAQSEPVLAFADMMDALRAEHERTQEAILAGSRDRSLLGFVQELVRRVKLEEAVRAEYAKTERMMEVRLDILRDFVSSVGAYEERTWNAAPAPDEEDEWEPPSLRSFVERISLVEDEEKKDDRDDEPNRVTLMSLHSAKGLEFTHVFIVGLEEELLPHSRSVQAVGEEGMEGIAEERRLFYVGITRARHRLTLSGCATRGQWISAKDKEKAKESGGGGRFRESKPRQPSRFLKEVPADLLEYRTGKKSSLSEEESQEFKKNYFANLKAMLGAEG